METPIEYLEKEYIRLYNGIVKISMLSSFETAKKMEQEINQVKNSVGLADVSKQRELLLAFAMSELNKPISDFNREWFEKTVDEFLANNCG